MPSPLHMPSTCSTSAWPLAVSYSGAFSAGSIAVMGTIITWLGYASNFRHWDISLKRTVGVLLGFVIAAGFYGGLIYLKIWFLPIAVGLGGLGVLLVLRRSKS